MKLSTSSGANIQLDEESRSKIADSLHKFLASSYALRLKTQNYHWNVQGDEFSELHELFEEHYDEMDDAIDVVAERIRILGATVPANLAQFSQLAAEGLDKNDETANSHDMVADLIAGHELAIQSIRESIQVAEQAQPFSDEGTMDMLVGMLRFHEKAHWMLSAHNSKG